MSWRRHRWELLGGDGGWELWRCRRCGRESVPWLFFLWPGFRGCPGTGKGETP